MSGVRDSEKRNYIKKEKYVITFEDVEKKYRKEDMSVEEFAILIAGKKAEKASDSPDVYTGKTIKNYLIYICEKSDGLLTLDDFRMTPGNPKSKYIFHPQHHALLLTLMASDIFDGRKNDRHVITRSLLYNQLIDNINSFLEIDDRKIIQKNPTYYNAQLESELTHQLITYLSSMIQEAYHSDPVIRYQLLIELLSNFASLNRWITNENVDAISKRFIYASELDSFSDAKYQKGVFRAKELDEFLAKYLALVIHGEKYNYLDDNEELSYPAAILASKLFHFQITQGNELSEVKEQYESIVENEDKYKKIINRAKEILDCSDREEAFIYNVIERTAKINFLSPYVTEEDYEKAVRFVEESIKKDKLEILSEFCKFNGQTISEDEIQIIKKIKDHEL